MIYKPLVPSTYEMILYNLISTHNKLVSLSEIWATLSQVSGDLSDVDGVISAMQWELLPLFYLWCRVINEVTFLGLYMIAI